MCFNNITTICLEDRLLEGRSPQLRGMVDCIFFPKMCSLSLSHWYQDWPCDFGTSHWWIILSHPFNFQLDGKCLGQWNVSRKGIHHFWTGASRSYYMFCHCSLPCKRSPASLWQGLPHQHDSCLERRGNKQCCSKWLTVGKQHGISISCSNTVRSFRSFVTVA